MEYLISCLLLLVLVCLWFRWRWKKTCVFKELGIPGPKPNFWFGNMLELYKKGPVDCQREWFQKYGKVVGFYYGMRPILLVSDTELLRKIFIKDFNLFMNRPEAVPMRFRGVIDYILPTRSIFDSLLVNLTGQRWKNVRKILTPTFSAVKMKLIVPIMNKAIDVTVSRLEEKATSGETFEIYDVFRKLSLDIICETAFALKTNIQQEEEDAFFKSAKVMFETSYKSNFILLGMCFPEIASLVMVVYYIWALIRMGGVIPPFKITWMIGRVIKDRRQSKTSYADLLQLMIEASTSQSEDDRTEHQAKVKMRLTDKEIQANSLLVFLAGFETTSTVLAYVFHLLVKYPEYQEKIRAEIDEILEFENELTYSSVSKLKLLDRFFLESMRLYPPVSNFINRIAITDVRYDDLYIRKGMQIQFPICHIHSNPEFWPSPDVFDPDRFLPENKKDNFSVTFAPFGVGPRNCLGIRFATMEVKLAVAKLLHRYIFISSEKEPELNIEMKLSTRVPQNVFVKVCERKNE